MASEIILPLLAGVADATAPPGVLWTTAGRPYLAFDQTTDERAVWTFAMPGDYSSGLKARVLWSGSSGTATNTAVWEVEVMAATPETDAVDNSTDSFDTLNSGTDTVLGTTAKRPQVIEITLSNNDSIAANDYAAIRLTRNGGTLAEDAWLWAFSLVYTAA